METQECTLKLGVRKNENRGQAVLEFVLVLMLVLGFAAALYTGMSSLRNKMWKIMLCTVSAACANCKSTATAQSAPGNIKCKK